MLGLFQGGNDGHSFFNILLGRRKDLVNGVDLAGIDDAFAVKTQGMDELCLGDKALFVINIALDAVNSGDTGCTGGVQQHTAAKKELGPFGRAGRFQVGNIILRPQRNAYEPLAGLGNITGVEDPFGRLNSSHHAGAANF